MKIETFLDVESLVIKKRGPTSMLTKISIWQGGRKVHLFKPDSHASETGDAGRHAISHVQSHKLIRIPPWTPHHGPAPRDLKSLGCWCAWKDIEAHASEETKRLAIASVPAPVSTIRLDPPIVSKWRYRVTNDVMAGGKTELASIDSNNTFEFAFPYSGRNQPELTIRKKANGRLDVLLMIDKGQFVCRIDGCSVLVKFDDKKPIRFSANEPSDHSTTVLFISSEKKFISQVKASKRLDIEAVFFQEGSRVMSFDTAGLIWK